MRDKNSIFFIDPDNDYRQELISRFATAIEDFKLCGVKDLEEMEKLITKGFLKKNKNYLVLSDQLFNTNGDSLSNIVATFVKMRTVQKIIIYSSKSEEIEKNFELSKLKKLMAIKRNDFSFYRIQNIIRNSVNHSDFNRALFGLGVSVSIFVLLAAIFFLY